jgi:CheY-like chemotaxis protein
LLAFSRKQVIAPRAVDLNRLIGESRNLLQRLVGEHIEIVTRLDPALGQVMADPGQLHQVLMNLAVNARDAMPSGGTLTIVTANAELDESYAAGHPEVAPGPFVLLAVNDTGPGVPPELQERIFDPFFTTKGAGEGTGLGLSTVHGIVRQGCGSISLRSEPGRGATFDIYLPRLEGSVEPLAGDAVLAVPQPGTETILVVEDQAEVRKLTVAVLERHGYRVLEAATGNEALLAAERHPGKLHLLLTDVVMPHMTGKELAQRLRSLRPEIKVLYMSGYADKVIAQQGVLDPGVECINKPFTPDALAFKVRQILGTPPPAGLDE